MPQTVIVLTEDALTPSDVAQIRALESGVEVTYRVLVPTEVEHSVVTDFLNNLALLDLKEAWEDLTGANHVDEGVARTEATTALGLSVTQLESAGAVVESATVADEPIAALRLELEASDALQIIAVTQPRPVEDTFHRNWADRAHAELGVPVLHFYSGTSYVGS